MRRNKKSFAPQKRKVAKVMEFPNEVFSRGGTPPQNLDKKRDRAFSRRRRPRSPSNRLQLKMYSVCRALWAPPNHLSSSGRCLECIAGERE